MSRKNTENHLIKQLYRRTLFICLYEGGPIRKHCSITLIASSFVLFLEMLMRLFGSSENVLTQNDIIPENYNNTSMKLLKNALFISLIKKFHIKKCRLLVQLHIFGDYVLFVFPPFSISLLAISFDYK